MRAFNEIVAKGILIERKRLALCRKGQELADLLGLDVRTIYAMSYLVENPSIRV